VDDPVVQTLQAVFKAATGRDDEPYTMGGGTYSRVVPNAVSFGPGMPGTFPDLSDLLPQGHGHAHGRDEALPVDKMVNLCRIYVGALAALDDTID
jgi:succinyl-diaminopimelate desuccinylase